MASTSLWHIIRQYPFSRCWSVPHRARRARPGRWRDGLVGSHRHRAALVYIDDIYRGVTAVPTGSPPMVATRSITSGARQGYQDYETTFSVNAGQMNGSRSPLPVVLDLRHDQVQSVPTGANVYIDGRFMGPPPPRQALSQDVIAGKHIVAVRRTVTSPTRRRSGASGERRVWCEPEPGPSDGSIRFNFARCHRRHDGVDLRTAPVTFANVGAGAHTILASRARYYSVSGPSGEPWSTTQVEIAQPSRTVIRFGRIQSVECRYLHRRSLPRGNTGRG